MRKIYLSLESAKEPGGMVVSVADGYWNRLKGLLGTISLPESQGLLLCGCNSVHMIGMLYPLDIIYLDKDGSILKIVENLKPFQLSCCLKAKNALEVKSGTARRAGWQVGEQLKWQAEGAES